MSRVLLLMGLSLLACLVAPWIGPPLEGDAQAFVMAQLRFPRAALAALIGATLGLTGAAFQVVLENPLATPSTIGTTAGAGLGALLVLVLSPSVGAAPLALGAFVGAMAVSVAIASLATLPGLRTEDLLLAGIAITLGAGAATTGLQLQADAAATVASVRWALGSVATVGYDKVLNALPLTLLGGAAVLTQLRALQTMTAGAQRAQTQGVTVERTRFLVLGGGSLAVASCVAAAGPISFVGLVVPHIVRRVVPGGPRTLLPLSAFVGAGFLPLADGLSRTLLPGRDVPVGVLTACLGAPTLLYLLLRRRR